MIERQHLASLVAVMVAVTGCMNSPRGGQTTAAAVEPADFTNAAAAEVKNAQGQVVLTGRFAVNTEADDDIERKATLTPSALDADAAGEAEVEVDRSGNPRRQEVEFSVTNVQPGATYTFVIDGKVVATVTADSRGRASYERDVPLPATSTAP